MKPKVDRSKTDCFVLHWYHKYRSILYQNTAFRDNGVSNIIKKNKKKTNLKWEHDHEDFAVPFRQEILEERVPRADENDRPEQNRALQPEISLINN